MAIRLGVILEVLIFVRTHTHILLAIDVRPGFTKLRQNQGLFRVKTTLEKSGKIKKKKKTTDNDHIFPFKKERNIFLLLPNIKGNNYS